MRSTSRRTVQAPARPASRAVLACWLAMLACRGPEPPPPGDYQRDEGDGCGYAPSECADAHGLWECRERAWALVDCDEACADEGGAVGCLAGELAGDGARCWCADFAPECTPGALACASEDEVRVCQADTLQYEVSSCDAVCAALEPPRESLGCDDFEYDGCGCTLEGTPCAAESVPHCEYDELAACVDGRWTLEPCNVLCPGGTCDPFSDGGAACVCDDA